MDAITLAAIIIIAAVLYILAVYYFIQTRSERHFRQWQSLEMARWEEDKAQALKNGIAQSRAVLGGKFTEQMAPYLPDFRYDPTEARFIGSPIDFIVFPGLASGEPREIIIMEIKSGRTATLTPAQRRIRQLIEDGLVRWELLQKPADD